MYIFIHKYCLNKITLVKVADVLSARFIIQLQEFCQQQTYKKEEAA